jgi:hypothetical protein
MERIEKEMNPVQKHLISYSELRERQKSNVMLRSEVPIEHAVSLPLPTLRWEEPAYAYFAAPALRTPDAPMQQSAPDRWWVLAAHGGRLLIYALAKALAFPSDQMFEPVTLPRLSMSRDELRQSLKTMEELLDALAPQFFAGEAGDQVLRKNLAAMLAEMLPQPLQPQYRALTPDFFAWLEK